ncbi:MAG: AAA family ATPase [bacterium]|nr:AAA family ATPase [bacterium]MDE0289267.1 AAA family ATPase [bacterium]
MRLVKAHVTNFQSVRASIPFKVGDVTCLVGKNESGKTALLKAIYRLNPVNASDSEYNVTDDYPRSTVSDYEADIKAGRCSHAEVVRATFGLEDEDIAEVTSVYGEACLPTYPPTVTLSKGYDNTLRVEHLDIDRKTAIQHLVTTANLPTTIESDLVNLEDVQAMLDLLSESRDQTGGATELHTKLRHIEEQGLPCRVYDQLLNARLPKFLYFDDYYQMKGQDNIEALKRRKASNALQESDYPLLGLLKLAGLELNELSNPMRTERLISKLEGAENKLTQQVLAYWSQNRHLRMKFDVRQAQSGDPAGMTSGTNIWGRVQDTRHMVSTALGSRSRGFVWFFSFLAWYSELRSNGENLILLLDEPGLSLHAKAQADLLRYVEEELVPYHQVMYTTHSPFMVDPSRFDRVRIVQDLSIEDSSGHLSADQEGTKVLTDVLMATRDSLFPLQGALGYEIHQSLFIGPNSLVVEGVSDLLYIKTASEALNAAGREGLSQKWTITPVGGSDKVATFVALIGAQSRMNVATLIDYQLKDQQTIANLYKQKLLKKSKVLTFADFVEAHEADIEDLFDLDFYLELVNAEFGTSIQPGDLPREGQRITVRLNEYLKHNPLPDGAKFNHYRPARYLTENSGTLGIPDSTLERFGKAFTALNRLLS